MSDSRPTRRLGPYRIQRVLGRGGMGTVYVGVEESTGQTVAIKALAPGLANDISFRERFAAEIESLKKLRHANIVQLYGFGEQDGQLYYAMQLIEGHSLQEEIARSRRFGWRETTRIAIEICAALKHAHDHGIIHRDLKPANLLIDDDDRIKLFDFGIAKLFGSTSQTTGSVMGTADYMAPEQAEGKAVGPRTDLYSLGSVMYALLAGRPPFKGKSIPEVVHKVRFDAPLPVSRYVADVPEELELLIEQLLAKNPEDRIPTALAVSHRLKAMEHALSLRPRESELVDQFDTPTDSKVVEKSSRTSAVAQRPTVELKDGVDIANLTVSEREPPGSGESRFTSVADETSEATGGGRTWHLLGRLAMLVVLVLFAYSLVRYFLQPPAAEKLYQRIVETEDLNDPRTVADLEPDIERFLELYPEDERRFDVLTVKEEIEVVRLRRKLEAKRRSGQSTDSPLEQFCLNALRQVESNPELAAEQLQAVVDVYGDDPNLSGQQLQFISVAQRTLGELRKKIDELSQKHLELISRRIEDARAVSATDPQQARTVYMGIIKLYGNKVWARDAVDQVQKLLDEL